MSHSYRCPVCGHVDDVSLTKGEAVRIRCSYCATLLEVELDRNREEAAGARVADPRDESEDPAAGSTNQG